MDLTSSIEEILDFAVKKEEEAFEFYTTWSKKVAGSSIKTLLLEFSEEEKKHKKLILELKEGGKILDLVKSGKQGKSIKDIPDLKISDYLVELSPSDDMDYQQALILAMQREKAAFKLYTDLGTRLASGPEKDLLHRLAQEEARHKLRLETIYDDEVLREN